MFAAKGATFGAAKRGASWAKIGRETELSCLHMSIEQWLKIPAIFVVVFDGDQRPLVKRGKRVNVKEEHQLAPAFRELLDASGFDYLTAPGEAEAYLAALNRSERINYVLTSDCDVFLFGAQHVIRTPQEPNNRDIVQVYHEAALRTYDSGALLSEGVILMAVLVGGDYDEKGLRGCGFETAYTLARTSSLPADLVAIMRNKRLSSSEILVQLSTWRSTLCRQLVENPHLRSRRPALAASIPEKFPQREILDLYINPVTEFSGTSQPNSNWEARFPDSAQMVVLAARLFGWSWKRTLQMLRESIWPGHMDHSHAGPCSGCLGSQTDLRIIQLDGMNVPAPVDSFILCRIELGTFSAQSLVHAAYQNEKGTPTGISSSGKASDCTPILVPSPIVWYADRTLFDRYNCQQYPMMRARLKRCRNYFEKRWSTPSSSSLPQNSHLPTALDAANSTLGSEVRYVITRNSVGQEVLEIIDD
ncbi:hypothetical protein EST38_g14060 [Candolleomyces aberdarensis]|uniref:XPG-I domain-containing protein n=1 Tax=Candolleomyces aberdarensis TaxID=2316362 RepID=A0A4Q2D0Z5_9AGAR|nr:hypothetical protein EST38_g14060 [Candolleomyces aberdarensis]